MNEIEHYSRLYATLLNKKLEHLSCDFTAIFEDDASIIRAKIDIFN